MRDEDQMKGSDLINLTQRDDRIQVSSSLSGILVELPMGQVLHF